MKQLHPHGLDQEGLQVRQIQNRNHAEYLEAFPSEIGLLQLQELAAPHRPSSLPTSLPVPLHSHPYDTNLLWLQELL